MEDFYEKANNGCLFSMFRFVSQLNFVMQGEQLSDVSHGFIKVQQCNIRRHDVRARRQWKMKAILTERGKSMEKWRDKGRRFKGMHFVLPKQFKEDVYLNFQVIYIYLPRRITPLLPFHSNALLLNSGNLYSRRQEIS